MTALRSGPSFARRTGVLIAFALLAISSLPLPSAAASPVASGGGPHSGWVALRVSLTGDQYSFYAASLGTPGTVQVGYAMYDQQGTWVRGLTFTQSDEDHGVRVEGDGVPTVQGPTGVEVLSGGDFAPSLTGTMNGPGSTKDQGIYYLVLWIAQKGGAWTWNVGGALEVLGMNEGQGSIALTSSDLSGTLTVIAKPIRRWGGPSVFLLNEMQFEIENLFLGAGDAPLVRTHALVVTRPGGIEARCPCAPREARGPSAWGPGVYLARHNGLNVVLTGGTDLHVMGVDVEIPWA